MREYVYKDIGPHAEDGEAPDMTLAWESCEDIATKFKAITSERAYQTAVLLGLRDSKHCRRASHSPRRVDTYSPEAVGLIERELRSRGARLKTVA